LLSLFNLYVNIPSQVLIDFFFLIFIIIIINSIIGIIIIIIITTITTTTIIISITTTTSSIIIITITIIIIILVVIVVVIYNLYNEPPCGSTPVLPSYLLLRHSYTWEKTSIFWSCKVFGAVAREVNSCTNYSIYFIFSFHCSCI